MGDIVIEEILEGLTDDLSLKKVNFYACKRKVKIVFHKYTYQNQQCKDILKVLFGKMLKTSPQEAELLLCFLLCEKINLEYLLPSYWGQINHSDYKLT